MVLLGKNRFPKSTPPATASPGSTSAVLGRFHHRAFRCNLFAGAPWVIDPMPSELRRPRLPRNSRRGPSTARGMTMRKILLTGVAAIGIAVVGWIAPASLQAQQAVTIDNDDIGGVVTGPKGPEAGVWVIAETRDLPVRFIRIVVTDDQGRYVVPDLPKANYDVWVRGYGVVDSPKVKSAPGKLLNLKAVTAPSEAAAAQYYPALYWFAMMKIPEASVFVSKDAPSNVKLTDDLNVMKNNGCVGCHQLGQLSTRTIPKYHLEGKTHQDAWVRRIQSGQAGENMVLIAAGQPGGMPFKNLRDWTERRPNG